MIGASGVQVMVRRGGSKIGLGGHLTNRFAARIFREVEIGLGNGLKTLSASEPLDF